MNIKDIGYQWRITPDGDYVEVDIHNSNFHPGTHASDSPKYVKVQYNRDGNRYIMFQRKAWFIDGKGE